MLNCGTSESCNILGEYSGGQLCLSVHLFSRGLFYFWWISQEGALGCLELSKPLKIRRYLGFCFGFVYS